MRRRNVVLVTGFECFDGMDRNPSQEVALALEGTMIAGSRVEALVLPCVFREAPLQLVAAIQRLKPMAVLCLGLARRSRILRVERRAANWVHARIPDNTGRQPQGRPILRRGPAYYFGTLPVQAVLSEWSQADLPARVSASAGGFVCNYLYYHLMHCLRFTPVPAGFIHLPPLPRDRARQRLAELFQVKAVKLAIAATLRADRI